MRLEWSADEVVGSWTLVDEDWIRGSIELVRMNGTGEYSIADLAEVFTVSRATVYRVLNRNGAS